MTPREQTDKASKKYFDDYLNGLKGDTLTVTDTYKEGAEYGYNLAIDNVVEYLKANVSSFTLNSEEMDGLPKRNRVELHQLIKQAMKL